MSKEQENFVKYLKKKYSSDGELDSTIDFICNMFSLDDPDTPARVQSVFTGMTDALKKAVPKGLYIHVPFCVKKCPYCDFYSEELKYKDEYIAAVLRNLDNYPIDFSTVYFGGGTPTLVPELPEKVLESIELNTEYGDVEITVECNPETVNEAVLNQLKKAGVNRLSFGVQSLDDEELKALGRIHSAQKAIDAIVLASELGFKNISVDLMLGIPNQTEESLLATLDKVCSLPITHVSAYMLKVEENTPFGQNPPDIADDEQLSQMYLTTVKELEKRGFMQYEISNFAKEGYRCKHNMKYWRVEEYIGIGPSAHSFYRNDRYAVPKDLKAFIENEDQIEQTVDENRKVMDEFTTEHIMLGLRLTDGVKIDDDIRSKLPLIPKNLYKLNGNTLSLTPEGFLVSNSIISTLIK